MLDISEIKPGQVWKGGSRVVVESIKDDWITYSWFENGEKRFHTKDCFSFQVRYSLMESEYYEGIACSHCGQEVCTNCGCCANTGCELVSCPEAVIERNREKNLGDGPLTKEIAEAIYDILVRLSGALESERNQFIYQQTTEFVREWRFCGKLGFGGKLRRPKSRLCVDCYPEDNTPRRTAIICETNLALKELVETNHAS